jgi:hypothetical protein
MNDKLLDIEIIEEKEVTPRILLRFAKLILLFVVIIFIMASISELFFPDNKVFEVCRNILPSLTTLIIGYYFGKS